MKNLACIGLFTVCFLLLGNTISAQSAPKKNPSSKDLDKQRLDSIALEREWEALLKDMEGSYGDIQQELDQLDNEEEQIMDWYFTETNQKPQEKKTNPTNPKTKNPPKSK